MALRQTEATLSQTQAKATMSLLFGSALLLIIGFGFGIWGVVEALADEPVPQAYGLTFFMSGIMCFTGLGSLFYFYKKLKCLNTGREQNI